MTVNDALRPARRGVELMGWRRRMNARERRLFDVLVFGMITPIWIVAWAGGLFSVISNHEAGYDLRVAFLPAADAVVHGHSPYPIIGDASLANQSAYVYPPFVAFVTAPLLLPSETIAVGIGIAISYLLVIAMLLVAEVRDWRCYVVALSWAPVLNAAQNVNVSIGIAFVVALAWRLRGSSRLCGAALGLAVAAKLFVWPLLAWPLATRRWRTLAMGIFTGAFVALGSWAIIGFEGLTRYPSLLRALSRYEETESYSLSGALRVLGFPTSLARAVALVTTLALLALCIRLARQRSEPQAFAAAIFAALTSTPILWQHYLTLLLVVLAVCRPRLTFLWFLPLTLWLSPRTGNGDVVQTIGVPLMCAVLAVACLQPRAASTPERARVASPGFS